MLLNQDVILESSSGRIRLVPYLPEHVPQYHKWMSSSDLLHLTASEPLSLSEEYASMQRWREDPNKLTFIIVAADTDKMIGDVNVVMNIDVDRSSLAEVDVMVAETSARRIGIGSEALRMAMAYAIEHLGVTFFVAKILEDNAPSIALFENFHFTLVKRVEAFRELHFELRVTSDVRQELDAVRLGWRQTSYTMSSTSTAQCLEG